MSCSSSDIPETPHKITLVVEDSRILVDPAIFSKYPDTMLGTMFGSALENNFTRPNENGEFEVAEGMSAVIFRAILEYYEKDVISCPPTVSASELRHACDYLLIPFNSDTIRCGHKIHDFLEEHPNDAARKALATFLQEDFLPVVKNEIQKGEEEGCCIFLLGDNFEGWDIIIEFYSFENELQIVNKEALKLLQITKHWNLFEKMLKESVIKEIQVRTLHYEILIGKPNKITKGEPRYGNCNKIVEILLIIIFWGEEESEESEENEDPE